jgi:hypothetical protein
VKELADLIRLNNGAVTRKQRAFELGAGEKPTEDDIAIIADERERLESELSAINTFLHGGDKSRLSGTALEPLI